jgi:hypothetical protein
MKQVRIALFTTAAVIAFASLSIGSTGKAANVAAQENQEATATHGRTGYDTGGSTDTGAAAPNSKGGSSTGSTSGSGPGGTMDAAPDQNSGGTSGTGSGGAIGTDTGINKDGSNPDREGNDSRGTGGSYEKDSGTSGATNTGGSGGSGGEK